MMKQLMRSSTLTIRRTLAPGVQANQQRTPEAHVADLNERLENRLSLVGEEHFADPRITDNMEQGINALICVVFRAAEIFRHQDTESFKNALEDERTGVGLFRRLTRGTKDGRTDRIEEVYALGVDYLHRRPAKRLIHNEYSGDFLTLQPDDVEFLEGGIKNGICPFVAFMAQSAVLIADELERREVLPEILGRANNLNAEDRA